jgi:hypothetical protein
MGYIEEQVTSPGVLEAFRQAYPERWIELTPAQKLGLESLENKPPEGSKYPSPAEAIAASALNPV